MQITKGFDLPLGIPYAYEKVDHRPAQILIKVIVIQFSFGCPVDQQCARGIHDFAAFRAAEHRDAQVIAVLVIGQIAALTRADCLVVMGRR